MALIPRSKPLRWILGIALALVLASMLIPAVQNARPLRRLQPLEPDIVYEYTTPPRSSAYLVALGWLEHLDRSLAGLHPSAGTILGVSLALAAFIGVVHLACREICARMSAAPIAWRFDLSLCVAGLALLLAVSGGAVRGLVTQIATPAVDPTPAEYRYQIRSLLRKELVIPDFTEAALTRIGYALKDDQTPKPQADSARPLHSWQTLILPQLYNFARVPPPDLEAPWDAEANRGTFARPVIAYTNPDIIMTPADDARLAPYAPSHIAGNVHVLGTSQGLAHREITNGTGQTILAGQVAANFAPWGKPGTCRDPGLGINRSPDGFGAPASVTVMLMCDGSVRTFAKDTDLRILRAMARPAGGEPPR